MPGAGDAIFRAASAAGIAYSSGTAFHTDGQGAEHIALSFACMPSSRISEGIEKLAAIVRRHLTAPRALQRPANAERETRLSRMRAGTREV